MPGADQPDRSAALAPDSQVEQQTTLASYDRNSAAQDR
jgi:hypothetical protein